MTLTLEEREQAERGVAFARTVIQTPSWRKQANVTLESIRAGMPGSKDWEGVEFALTVLWEGRDNYAVSRKAVDRTGTVETNPHRLLVESILPIRNKLRAGKGW